MSIVMGLILCAAIVVGGYFGYSRAGEQYTRNKRGIPTAVTILGGIVGLIIALAVSALGQPVAISATAALCAVGALISYVVTSAFGRRA